MNAQHVRRLVLSVADHLDKLARVEVDSNIYSGTEGRMRADNTARFLRGEADVLRAAVQDIAQVEVQS